MKKRNGFTLVELMVVIVIIGVLAAVAIPKMMAATNKAKASEGPQLLSSIDNLQTAFRGEYNAYTLCAAATTGGRANVGSGWKEIGMDIVPFSKYFRIGTEGIPIADPDEWPAALQGSAADDILFVGSLTAKLGDAPAGASIGINGYGIKGATNEDLRALVSNFAGATVWGNMEPGASTKEP